MKYNGRCSIEEKYKIILKQTKLCVQQETQIGNYLDRQTGLILFKMVFEYPTACCHPSTVEVNESSLLVLIAWQNYIHEA